MFFQIGIWHRSQLVRRKESVNVAVHLSPSIEFFKKKYGNLKHTWETSSCSPPPPPPHKTKKEKKKKQKEERFCSPPPPPTDMKQMAKEKTFIMNSEFAYVLFTSYYRGWISHEWKRYLQSVFLQLSPASISQQKSDAYSSRMWYEIVVNMNQIYINGITLSISTKTNTLLFADDQVIIADSENNLQRQVFHITNHSKKFWNRNITSKIWDDWIFRTRPSKV